MTETKRRAIMDAAEVEACLDRMADWIESDVVDEGGPSVIVGIHRRGVQLADRLVARLRERGVGDLYSGTLDITLYRDDLMAIGPRPVVGETRLPTEGVDELPVVIVDDVLYTGRTVRAALDELADFGRPSRTMLAVVVDRGGRELPIQADFVGRAVEVAEGEWVEVAVPEIDGRLGVDLVQKEEEA